MSLYIFGPWRKLLHCHFREKFNLNLTIVFLRIFAMFYFENFLAKTKSYYFRENGDNDHFRLNSLNHSLACPTNSTFLFICNNEETPVFVLLYSVLYVREVWTEACLMKKEHFFHIDPGSHAKMTVTSTIEKQRKQQSRNLWIFLYYSSVQFYILLSCV